MSCHFVLSVLFLKQRPKIIGRPHLPPSPARRRNFIERNSRRQHRRQGLRRQLRNFRLGRSLERRHPGQDAEGFQREEAVRHHLEGQGPRVLRGSREVIDQTL